MTEKPETSNIGLALWLVLATFIAGAFVALGIFFFVDYLWNYGSNSFLDIIELI